MTTSMNRRTLTKGAAWAAPAIAVAAATPAMAASSFPDVTCLSTTPLTGVVASDTGLKSWTGESGSLKSYDTTSGHSDLGMGTLFQLNMGMFQFNKPASYVTGYRMAIGDGGINSATTQARIKTVSGVVSAATITTTGVGTAQVITAGITQNIDIQSQVPYTLVGKKAYNVPAIISVPFCLTYLAGLDATQPGTQEVGTCCYWINYTYDYSNSPDAFGNYPDSSGVANSGNAWTITTAPAI